MGEAKRRKEAGRIRTVLVSEYVEALNRAAGAEAWVPVVSRKPRLLPRWVFMIDAEGRNAGVVDRDDDEVNAALPTPHRFVMLTVQRHGQAIAATGVMDFGLEYSRDALDQIGGEAARLYDDMRGEPGLARFAHSEIVSTWLDHEDDEDDWDDDEDDWEEYDDEWEEGKPEE